MLQSKALTGETDEEFSPEVGCFCLDPFSRETVPLSYMYWRRIFVTQKKALTTVATGGTAVEFSPEDACFVYMESRRGGGKLNGILTKSDLDWDLQSQLSQGDIAHW